MKKPIPRKRKKPWISVNLDDFKAIFGEGIVNRLEAPSIDILKNSIGAKELREEKTSFLEERFDFKVNYLSAFLQNAILNALEGNTFLLKEVDTKDLTLKKILMDLIAYEFLGEIGGINEKERLIFSTATQTHQMVEDWSKSVKPLRLKRKRGGFVDSHTLSEVSLWI